MEELGILAFPLPAIGTADSTLLLSFQSKSEKNSRSTETENTMDLFMVY